MLVRHVPATAFGTNCWVLAPGPGGPCVVVDPGFGVTPELHRLLVEESLRPVALLVTHGHADHVWSVTPLQGGGDTPVAVHVHPADRHRLHDPLAHLGAGFGADLLPMLRAHLGSDGVWAEPQLVVDLPAPDPSAATPVGGPGPDPHEARVVLAGLEMLVRHTPGHTEGSVCFRVPAAAAGHDVLVSGDLLFAGSVGRTDLPGGDPSAMERSLAQVMAAHDDATTVLPGHGPVTTIGAERATNPYVAGAAHAARRAAGRGAAL